MDKNYRQKAKDFFRKEGFYVVLFLCLCIVTTVAAVSLKKAQKSKTEANVEGNNKEISLNVDDKNVTNEMPNAERVDNSTNKLKAEEKNNNTAAVANNSEVQFNKPLEGTLVRGYTYPKPVKIDENTQRTIRGIDITAKVGISIKAAAEGIVEEAGKGQEEEGIRVVIKHANGMKTVYCNLDSKLNVKKGDKVTTETVIGKVGNSIKIYGDIFGEFLNLQVVNAKNEQVDPLKYFAYKSK